MDRIICNNCGAEFDKSEVKCPHCGFLYAPGMEKKYMGDLEKTREKLDVVDDEARDEYKDEAKKSGKKVLIILGVVAAIILVVVGIAKLQDYLLFHEKISAEEELLWQQENFPILDKYFEEGDYDACFDIIYDKKNEDHHFWDWQHYEEFRKILDEKFESVTGGESG